MSKGQSNLQLHNCQHGKVVEFWAEIPRCRFVLNGQAREEPRCMPQAVGYSVARLYEVLFKEVPSARSPKFCEAGQSRCNN